MKKSLKKIATTKKDSLSSRKAMLTSKKVYLDTNGSTMIVSKYNKEV